MKIFFFIIYAVTVLDRVLCEKPNPLSIKFKGTKDQDISQGEQLNFECDINRGVQFLVDNHVGIIRQSAGEDSQVILTQEETIVTPDPRYALDFVRVKGNGILIKFSITNVTDEDEGMYICQARAHKNKGWEIQGNDSVNIRVLRALDVLLLKFDNNTAISKNFIDPIEVSSGVYTVACIAEGSNPAPTVNLYLNGSKVQNVHTMMETQFTKLRKTIIGVVSIKSVHSIECSAHSQLGDKHVKLYVKAKIYAPIITCNNSYAYEGQMNPVLACTVDYDGLNIKSFKYTTGKKTFEEGKHNPDFVQVSREQLSETKVRVHLILCQAKGWHFEKEFYLLVELADGREFREDVQLQQISGSGGVIVSSFLVALVLVACYYLMKFTQ